MRCDKFFGVFVLVVFCIGLAFAVILVDGGGTEFSSVNESVAVLYNFSVNNTQATQNITEVNVTLPAGFVFVSDSNGTSVASDSFVNVSSVLSWSDSSLILNGTLQNFWFNSTSSTIPGNYNITIIVSNSTGIFEEQNLSVTVNDTVMPSSVEFASTSESNNSNLSQSNIVVNVTAEDLGTLDTIIIKLYNSSSIEINSSSDSTLPVFINWTGLDDGVYYFNATANDTFGNSNSTVTRTVTLDVTDPSISYGTGIADDNANLSQSNIFVNVTASDINNVSLVFVLYNSTGEVNTTTYDYDTQTINWTGLDDGVYTYNVTANDSATNSNSTVTRTVTLDVTNPVATAACTPSSVTSGATVTCTCTGTDTNGSEINSSATTSSSTITTSTTGTITGPTCSVTDYAGNVGTDTDTYTVASSGGGSGNPIYRPSESKLAIGYDIFLRKNFKVSFNVAGESHTLKVDSISSDKAIITISSDSVTLELGVGETEKVDVNQDGIYDLSVNLKSISSSRANFLLTSISEKIATEEVIEDVEDVATEEVIEDVEDEESNIFLWVIVILILLIVGIVFVKRFRK